jgi:hypothetical protein
MSRFSQLRNVALLRYFASPSSNIPNAVSVRSRGFVALPQLLRRAPSPPAAKEYSREMSSRSRRGAASRRPPSRSGVPKPALLPEQAWVEVPDQASGLTYWWNQQTNETTHVGAPKPTGATALAVPPPQNLAQPQVADQQPSLGRIMAEGLAFGTGSAVAHRAVGSLFGGNSSSSQFDDSDDGDGGDFFDV